MSGTHIRNNKNLLGEAKMTSIEFAATVTAASAGNEEAVETLMRVACDKSNKFIALRARSELRKIGVEVRS